MEHQSDVGDISFYFNKVHWIIPSFYDLPQKAYTVIESPRFRFARRDWKMFVYPNGCSWDSSSGWFGISVRNESFFYGSREKLYVRLGIVGEFEKNIINSRADSDDEGNYHLLKLMRRSVLESKKDKMMSNENSTIQEKTEEGKDERENISQNVCMEAYSQSEAEAGIRSLQHDLKEFLISENLSDITLKVRDREFKAHRSILAARSPVFLAMLMHDTKEKITGIVDIKDTDPDTFSDFLLYMYTGNLEHMTSENVHNLYTTADIYQVNELKNVCLKFMLKNISVENFCDILTLSLQHEEKDMTDVCIHFFVQNSMEIVLSAKWQEFLLENPIIGNELFIKHLQMNKPQ